jgi:hypothetical protein
MDVIARIKKGKDALTPATRHILERVANCIEVNGGIFEKVLY